MTPLKEETERLKKKLFDQNNIRGVLFFDRYANKTTRNLNDEGYSMDIALEYLDRRSIETELVCYSDPEEFVVDFMIKRSSEFSYLSIYYEVDINFNSDHVDEVLQDNFHPYFNFIRSLDLESISILTSI